MGLRCETCGHYTKPRKILIYPNSDNDLLGWRTCAEGSTVRRTTMACGHHTAIKPVQKRQLIHEPHSIKRRIIK